MRRPTLALEHRMQRMRAQRRDGLGMQVGRDDARTGGAQRGFEAGLRAVLDVAGRIGGAHERLGPVAAMLDRDVAQERRVLGFGRELAAKRRQGAAAVEAHERAHILRRQRARRALAGERRCLDPHAVAPGSQQAHRRPPAPPCRHRGSATARAGGSCAVPRPRHRRRSGGSGCRGFSRSTPTGPAASGRTAPCRYPGARPRRGPRARDRTRSPRSRPTSPRESRSSAAAPACRASSWRPASAARPGAAAGRAPSGGAE